ncbi:MAG TPA: apolipoprotein N-acyltransferase [Methylomirabilota bacterium]|nr:apolipoprotein N-acyltransferase [Methylomirabilota bacterium]
MMNRLERTARRRLFLLAIASGVLSAVSVVFSSLFFFIWIAFAPLFLSLRTQSFGARLGLGFLAGITYFAGAFHWLWWSIAQFFAFSAFVASLLFLCFLLWHGFFFALFTAPLRQQSSASPQPLLPALWWVVLEHYYPALFPWQFSNMLQPHLPAIQLAEVTGVAGLSFLIVLVNSLLLCAYTEWREGKAWLSPAVAAVGVVIALEAYGQWRLAQVEAETPTRTLAITIIQGNASATREFNEQALQQGLHTYAQLSLSAALPTPALIVWPEVAVRATLRDNDDARTALFTLAEQLETPLLVGALDALPGGALLNSAFLISPAGELFGVYHKTRVLPFAESLPWPLSPIAPWWPSASFAAGSGANLLWLPGARFAVSICYESLFPGFFRQAVTEGAEFLVNLTNDVWLGGTSGPWSHLQAAAMRAVESRRWLVRAANSGVSAVIAPSGRIVARTNLFTKETLRESISLRQESTPYAHWGDWFVYVCLGGVFLVVLNRLGCDSQVKTAE